MAPTDPEQPGSERSDRARFECTCGSLTTFPKESFAKLHWLVGRFGYRNTEDVRADGSGESSKYRWECPECGTTVRDNTRPAGCGECGAQVAFEWVERVTDDDLRADGGEPEPLNLPMLNGATLKWEDSDGNIHSVEFDDNRSVDTESDRS